MRWTFGIPNPYTSQRISKMGSENDEVKNRLKRRYTELGKISWFGGHICSNLWDRNCCRVGPSRPRCWKWSQTVTTKNERKSFDILIYVWCKYKNIEHWHIYVQYVCAWIWFYYWLEHCISEYPEFKRMDYIEDILNVAFPLHYTPHWASEEECFWIIWIDTLIKHVMKHVDFGKTHHDTFVICVIWPRHGTAVQESFWKYASTIIRAKFHIM